MEEIPSNYKTAGILMLIAGIMNILFGVGLVLGIGLNVLLTFGVAFPCLICCVWVPVPVGFGIFELMTGIKVMNGQVVKQASTISIVGIVVGAVQFSVIGLVLEIIATVMLNDQEVKTWIAQHDPELLT